MPLFQFQTVGYPVMGSSASMSIESNIESYEIEKAETASTPIIGRSISIKSFVDHEVGKAESMSSSKSRGSFATISSSKMLRSKVVQAFVQAFGHFTIS